MELTCRWPECGRTRTSQSPDFCADHEFKARRQYEKALKEAEHETEKWAVFEDWCEQHGEPHPLH